MELHDKLTNEELGKKFTSQFDLVNYAIHLAKEMIKSGREADLEGESQNRAQQILVEIAEDRVILEDIEEESVFDKIEITEEIETEKNVAVG